MTEIIFVVEEELEGGYQSRALDHAIFTEGDTWESLKLNVKEAIYCHFEEEIQRTKIVRLHLVKEATFAA
ncbi:MAG: 2-oxoisovalerate dehydrogenase [Tunicatimonas sp.]|uniref:2-oxoisovalerate dehydrogenase E1 subunit beta n=1 Tax=Tunicatimonas sp. TaxID=1940096 RepID=UPI003C71903F